MTRAFQWDLARQVERLDFLLRWLPRYAAWGYQELYLHLEDAVEYPSLPAVARRGAYTYRQFARLVDAAAAAGIRVVPIVNLLGHTQYLIKVPGLRDLNELRDDSGHPLARGQICPLHPRTIEVAEKLLRDMAPFCTAGKVHVGLDESFHLGQCPRCRAEVQRVGLAGHFAAHVNRIHELTTPLGLRLGLWADMLALLPAAIPRLPRTVTAYDWYYYPFARHPRVELHNFAESDLATPLQARGVEYWGCPMNGAFRYEPMPVFGERLANIVSWWRRCQRVGAGGFLVTSWEANRLAFELTMAVDAAAACLWLNPEIDNPQEMLARGFSRVFGGKLTRNCRAASPDAAMVGNVQGPPGGVRRPSPTIAAEYRRWARAALAADEHAFTGYHRWQINSRWDTVLTREPLALYEKEVRALEQICRSLLAGETTHRLQTGSYKGCPPAFAASMACRLYLARRDIFVRRAAQTVFQIRRMMVGPAVPAGFRDIDVLADRGSPPGTAGSTSLRGVLSVFAKLRAEAAAFAAAIRAGRTAARAMWKRSRNPQEHGPNERMIERDAARLRAWERWLQRASRDPGIVWQATPVCGAWQLQFTVHNFAPALQKVAVEQQRTDGSWTVLHELPLIEFRADAARPRTKITRECSVPIPVAGPGSGTPATGSLRLAVRGVGQVAISRVVLTNGVTTLCPAGWPPVEKKIFGRPAPPRGFPVAAMSQTGSIPLVFLPRLRMSRKIRL